MKKFLLLGFLLTIPFSCFALLAPIYESGREIKMILDDPRLEKSFGAGQMILSIVKNEQGYVVETQDYKLQVKVTQSPTGKIGPVGLKVDFGDAVPLK